ncbi:transposase, partial [Bacteroides xylanisolvens]|uniref:ISAon1 family transposase n=1 Tax=Bacteroides xylanisolvens TaxID=371601 RepID=UPI001864584E
LYTILINRDKRGRKGSIIAVIQGTKTDDIIAVLTKMPQELRNQVKEITLDMAGSMQKIAKTCFPRAMQVIDRFHVQKLVYEAVQELRITYRWQVIKEENKAMKAAKEKGEVYKAEELENGDTLRQLLARSRYLLFKSPDKWTKSQKIRAELLFKQFEDIKHVYYYSLELGKIFSTNYDKDVARAKLALWYNKIEEYGYDTFTTVITYRWQVIKEENKAIKAAKEKGEVHKAEELENGDTLRQLLARSRYLLFKSPDKWTKSQKIRAELLFKQFEDIKHVYYYSLELGKIFSTNYDKDVARAKLALWYNKIEEYGYDTFTTVIDGK